MAPNTTTLPTPTEIKRSRRLITLGALVALVGGLGGFLVAQYLGGALLAIAGTAIVIYGGAANDVDVRAAAARTRRKRSYTFRWIFAIEASLVTIPNAILGTQNLQEYYLIPLSVAAVVVTFAMALRDSTGFYEKPLRS